MMLSENSISFVSSFPVYMPAFSYSSVTILELHFIKYSVSGNGSGHPDLRGKELTLRLCVMLVVQFL